MNGSWMEIKGKMTKNILFTLMSGQQVHKLWKNFLLNPPKGFKYINLDSKPLSFENKTSNKTLLEKMIFFLYKIKRKMPFLYYNYKIYEEKKLSKKIDQLNPDLIYCINGRLYHGKKLWIVDFENPTVFFGYNIETMKRYKERIKKVLLKDNCKAIITYSESGKKGFLGFFGNELEKKIFVIPNCTSVPKIKRKSHKGFNILFTGTANLADDFYFRGGREVIHAFILLSKKYPEIKLIIRCKLPDDEKKLIKGLNVEIHEEVLSKDQFENLFAKSDIYLFPAYVGYALSVIEAMGYGLPIISSNLLENAEPINNWENGFKIEPPKINYTYPFIPNYYFDNKYNFVLHEDYVDRIVDKVELLYNNKNIIPKISKNNIFKVEKIYSLGHKNTLLKKLYERSIKNAK